MKTYSFVKINSPEDLNISYKIRKKVFCEEQKISEKIEFDNLDHLCEHFLIHKDKDYIATARVRPKNKKVFKIERVAVLPEFRRLKKCLHKRMNIKYCTSAIYVYFSTNILKTISLFSRLFFYTPYFLIRPSLK